MRDTISTIQWRFSWGDWWRFDPYVNFSFDIPTVNVEYGREVQPPDRQVTPPAITVDPDPFALKVDAVHTLDDIQGLITVVDSEGTDSLTVHASESTAALTGGLVNAAFLEISRADDMDVTPGSVSLTTTTPLNGQNPIVTTRGSKVEIQLPDVDISDQDVWTLTIPGTTFDYIANTSDGLTPEVVAKKLAELVNDVNNSDWIGDDQAFYNLQGLGLRAGGVNGKPFNGVFVGGVDSVDIRLGDFSDQFDLDIHPIEGSPLITQLVLGGGADSVTVQSLAGVTGILGGEGADTVTVGNDQQTTDQIIENLHFDGNGTIVEQSSAIVYHPPTHDGILAAVPAVFTNTAGGTPSAPATQFKEPILTANRTAHVTVFGAPTVGALTGGVSLLNRSIAQFWTQADLTLQGAVTPGDVWTLRLDEVDYTYTVGNNDDLDDIAAGLVAAVPNSVLFVVTHTPDSETVSVDQGTGTPFTVQVINGLNTVASTAGMLLQDFVQFELSGPIVTGDTWEITLNGESYERVAIGGDTLQTIAAALRDDINAGPSDNTIPSYTAKTNQYLDIYVVDIDPFTGKPTDDTVHFRGVQEQGYIETGYQLYGIGVKGINNSATITIDQDNPNAVLLYEDALGQLTTVNSGKQVIVLTDSTDIDAVPLFRAENGTLTTSDATNIQAIQITQSSGTVVPLYLDSGDITTLTTATRATKADVDALTQEPAVPVQFDLNGNKALARPKSQQDGSQQTGFQVRGYQQYGYYEDGSNNKSTTNIGIEFNIVQNFNDEFAVPLYIRTDSNGIQQITTENIEDTTFITVNGAANGAQITLNGQGRTISDNADNSGTGQVVIPTNNIRGNRTWTLTIGSDVHTYVTGSNGDELTSLAVAKGLALAVNTAALNGVTADGEAQFTRPFIRFSEEHGGSEDLTVTDVNNDQVTIPRGTGLALNDQRLYLDANGNLTTENTGSPTDWRGFQRTDGTDPYFLEQDGTLTTVENDGYQQVIIVTNQLLYLDSNGNPTTDPTDSSQWIRYSNEQPAMNDFNVTGNTIASVPLYSDADGNPTNRVKKPFRGDRQRQHQRLRGSAVSRRLRGQDDPCHSQQSLRPDG